MSIKTLIFFVSLVVSINAAAAQFYRDPAHIPAGVSARNPDLSGVKCARDTDIAITVTKRNTSAGWITFAVTADAPDYEPMGRFQAGKPSKRSAVQKAMDEYVGPVPAFICIPHKGFSE